MSDQVKVFYSTKKRVKYYYIPIWIKLVKIIYMCKLKETRIDKDKINTIHTYTQMHNTLVNGEKNIIGVSTYFITFWDLIDHCKLKVLNLVIIII